MTTTTTGSRRTGRLATRLDPDTRGGLRLTLAALAGLLLAVPFGLLLLLVSDRWAPLQRLDGRVADGLHTVVLAHPWVVSASTAVSTVFHPTSFEVAAVVLAVALVLRRRPRLGIWLAVTVLGGGLLSTLVKNAVGRARPTFAHPVATAVSKSFPSGHALGAVVGVGALLLVALPSVPRRARVVVTAAGGLVILLVGLSRLLLGVHFLTDVLAGYVLGAAWLAATVAAFRVWHRERGAASDRDLLDGLEPEAPEEEVGPPHARFTGQEV